MRTLKEYRAAYPYNRQNTDGISVAEWLEGTRKAWIVETLDRVDQQVGLHSDPSALVLGMRAITRVLREMR